ncbi:hypothetical protein Dimus_025745 [Dionaea muscipula]
MGRAPCCDKDNVKKGPWSPEEDTKLKAYIEEYGTGGNWIALPQKIGLKRCGKSCRLRWLNYLRPNIKHGGFTEEEDNIICSLYISIGSRWSVIAAQLPGRTDNDIKNYWNTKLKKKLLLGRRKQQQQQLPSHSHNQEDAKAAAACTLRGGGIGVGNGNGNGNGNNNSYTPTLSSSALERLQLHIQLIQSLEDNIGSLPLLSACASAANHPAPLWPKLHPLQEKMIQNLYSTDHALRTRETGHHVIMPENHLRPSTGHDHYYSSDSPSMAAGGTSMVAKPEEEEEIIYDDDDAEMRFMDQPPEIDQLIVNYSRGNYEQQQQQLKEAADHDHYNKEEDQSLVSWWTNDLISSSCSWEDDHVNIAIAGSAVQAADDQFVFQDYPSSGSA